MASARNSADVLVIGAGMSGIAAAWMLRQVGIDPIVIEGRPDRIGGRIWSSRRWSEATVDLGASWVTHMTINPLVDIAATNHIALRSSELMNLTLTEANGTRLSDAETAFAMARYFELYAAVKLNAAKRDLKGKPDTGAADEFARTLKSMDLTARQRLHVEYYINYAVAEPNAADLEDLSLYHWDEDFSTTMLALAVVPDGYVQIAEVLARRLDIRLGHVVEHIDYGGDAVTVSTSRGEFTGKYAVCTLPHGVLAKDSVRFTPKLPDWKRDAIKRIHTGLSDKFYFLFPKVFWKSNRDILGRIDDKAEGRWSTWVNFHRYTDLPILLCFNRTEHALALESMTDDQVIDEAMDVLRKEYGVRTPDPLKMQRSMWHADPFAQGTLPHVPPGASGADYRTLARAIGRLRFAGDSTNADFPGNVFGAFLSGIREAQKLIGLVSA